MYSNGYDNNDHNVITFEVNGTVLKLTSEYDFSTFPCNKDNHKQSLKEQTPHLQKFIYIYIYNISIDRYTNKQIDKQTHKQNDRQIDRQIEYIQRVYIQEKG